MENTIGARTASALAWTITAAGSIVFGLVHLFGAIGALAAEAGHDHAHDHLAEYAALGEAGSGMSWMIAVFYTLAVVPPLLALASGSRGAAIASLVVGGLFALANVADGASHAITDGALEIALVAIVGVGVPAFVAIRVNLRWLRATRTPASEPVATAA